MDYEKLALAAQRTIHEIEAFTYKNGKNDTLESIKAQMKFISENAVRKINPVTQLGDRKFTYAILASRELASPEEMVIKDHIDNVSSCLDNE